MSKAVRFLLGGCLALILLLGAFSGGVAVGWLLPHTNPLTTLISGAKTNGNSSTAGSTASSDRESLFAPFWEAWDLVHKQYVDQPLDDVKLMQGAIRGMMDGLGDEHSSYMDPDEYRQANTQIEGSYEGIGAYVDTTVEYLTITSPMPGSPAEAAGLKAGDQIIKVDGEDMTG